MLRPTTSRKRNPAEPKVRSKSTQGLRGRSKTRNARPATSLQPGSKKASLLLALAPELRNRMWEFALVESEPITVNIYKNGDWTHVRQPALLRTCRQIRDEAIGTWYTSNTFLFKACNSFSITPYLPFSKQVRKYHKDPKARVQAAICPSVHPFGFDTSSLKDLMEWLKLYHADPDLVPSPAQDAGPFVMMSKSLANQTFGTVHSMRDKPWEAIELTLDAFFMAISLVSDVDSEYIEERLMDQLDARESDDGFEDRGEWGTDSGGDYDADDDDGMSVEGMD